MKTIVYSVIAVAILLTVCFIVSLVRGKTVGKKMRWTNLILPLLALLMFVGLFIGGSISRDNLRKALTEMKETNEKRDDYDSRLTMIEERNKDITMIIGRDLEIEKQIEALKEKN